MFFKKSAVATLHRMAQSPTLCKVLDGSLVKAADFYKRLMCRVRRGCCLRRFMIDWPAISSSSTARSPG